MGLGIPWNQPNHSGVNKDNYLYNNIIVHSLKKRRENENFFQKDWRIYADNNLIIFVFPFLIVLLIL